MLLQLFRPSGTTRPLFRGFMAPEFSGVRSMPSISCNWPLDSLNHVSYLTGN
jgi:hypothetical protein